MIKLPDSSFFNLFSAWRLFPGEEATPWGRAAQSSLLAGWVTCPEITRQHVQSHNPSSSPSPIEVKPCPLPAPMGATLPLEDAGHP